MQHIQPDEVMVHILLGNDVEGVDTTFGCCTGRPLLTPLPDGRMQESCPTPHRRDGVAERWIVGPPPYPLRFIANYSMAAVRLLYHLERLSFDLRSSWAVYRAQPETLAQRVDRMGRVVLAMTAEVRARGVPRVFSLIPPRHALVGQDANGEMHQIHDLVRRFVTRSGLPLVDAWNVFDEALRRVPQKEWFFMGYTYNPHSYVDGHELHAKWLDETWFGRAASRRPAQAARLEAGR